MGALRLLLAISVVLFHAHGLFHLQLAGGTVAVETFFMISGFVMALVLATKYDPVADRGLFYTNRILRIYIPYFVMVAVAFGVATFAFVHSGTGPFAVMKGAGLTLGAKLAVVVTHLTIVGQDAFLFFRLDHGVLQWSGAAPALNVVVMQLIPPAWSVSLELVFYALAPWLVRLRSRTLVGMIAASLALRVVFWRVGLPTDPWSYRFFPTEFCFFLAGVLAYRAYAGRRPQPGRDRLLGGALIAAVLAYQPAAIVLRHLGLSEEPARWAFYAAAFACMPPLFAWTNRSALDRFLGNFSYAVYLAHWPMLVLIDALRPHLDPNLRTGAVLVASLGVAYATAELVERPVDRWRQQRARRRAGVDPAATALAAPGLQGAAASSSLR